jgi:hypothetical protein
MNPNAIDKAQSRLRTAARALADLEQATDYRTFFDHWYVFLTGWKGVYTVLEQGAKQSAQSRQWFGAKKAERRADPLLQYLFEARNDEEHGLEPSIVPALGRMRVELPDVGVEGRQISVEANPLTGEMRAFRPDGGPLSISQSHGPGPALRPVKGRGGRMYGPPIVHLGQRIDLAPLEVARAGLRYVEALVNDAIQTCPPSP